MSNFFEAPAVRAGAGCLAALFLGTLVAAAQNPPLAEVARREEERRKTTKPATRVLTNKDLPKVTSPPPPVNSPEPPVADPVPGPDKAAAAVPDSGKVEKDETWWRTRVTDAREALRRNEVLVDALQARVSGIPLDYGGRGDPMHDRLADDRLKAVSELDRLRTETDELKKKIEAIEEEARKADVPPGWLR